MIDATLLDGFAPQINTILGLETIWAGKRLWLGTTYGLGTN
ncbi:MAG TPA: hypothetical protein VMW91_06885 [Desulfosporosinus sp.]|nr:hypothetical protein [Desulfosporosinus sp.]